MGIYIIKPERDRDFYVAWVSGVDGPGYWGTRAHVTDCLTPEDGAPERFDRADATGTSMRDGGDGWDGPYGAGFLVLNGGRDRGWIPRGRMIEWLEAGAPSEMLDPLEDDDHQPDQGA